VRILCTKNLYNKKIGFIISKTNCAGFNSKISVYSKKTSKKTRYGISSNINNDLRLLEMIRSLIVR
jgi:hypothetical protein